MATKRIDTDPTVFNTGENLKSNACSPPNMRKGKHQDLIMVPYYNKNNPKVSINHYNKFKLRQ